jgi:hypothetical protein
VLPAALVVVMIPSAVGDQGRADQMSTSRRYAGFLDHIQARLGPVADVEPPNVSRYNRGYALFTCQADGLVSVITNGIRFQPITGMPQELICTLRADQRGNAHLLTAINAELVMRQRQGLTLDQVVSSPSSLIVGTDITGVLVTPHLYAGNDFDGLRDETGAIELQLVTLTPLTSAEVIFAQQHGPEAIREQWENQKTDLLDIHRPSAV